MNAARVPRSWRAAVLAGAILLWAGGLVAAALPQARCLRVLDGDSVVLRLDGREVEARLDGIDAPERGQPFGDRARRELARLAAGRLVEVDARGTDRYGRLLVRLHAGGIEVNRELVRRGLAWHYERYSDDPALAAAEQVAQV
ncbi:MAG TPA: thermonuclease family protein, partial [Thermoanaerobaculia bacterium]|nr:thermonuclease family protein [Thermoanaerobaculia bacterium]